MTEGYGTRWGLWGRSSAAAPTSAASHRSARESWPAAPDRQWPAYGPPGAPPTWSPSDQSASGYEARNAQRNSPASPESWWLWWGIHGGAGITTLSQVCPMGREGTEGTVTNPYPPIVIVCRTHASGLLAAKALAASTVSAQIEQPEAKHRVVGLLTVADTPGSLPKGLAQLRRHVAGGFNHAWHVGWVEAWRCGEPASPDTTPASVHRVLAKVEQRVAEHINRHL
jgi:hypothetical protein